VKDSGFGEATVSRYEPPEHPWHGRKVAATRLANDSLDI
jgi:hypothetical protein